MVFTRYNLQHYYKQKNEDHAPARDPRPFRMTWSCRSGYDTSSIESSCKGNS